MISMTTTKKKTDFFESAEGIQTREILRQMDADPIYNTQSSYSANGITYPDNIIPFVDKHMKYLYEHPSVNLDHYISNLRLMTRIK